jgi:hypothetical protein
MQLSNLAIWCLIGYGRITDYCSSLSETCKTHLRSWLGPAPCSYQLLSDGRVLPSTVTLPASLLETAYTYYPNLVVVRQSNSTARPRRFSWVAITIEGVDLSDWIQSLRWVGATEPPLSSLITLWSMIHQQVFPFGTTINGTKNTAEEVQIIYE